MEYPEDWFEALKYDVAVNWPNPERYSIADPRRKEEQQKLNILYGRFTELVEVKHG